MNRIPFVEWFVKKHSTSAGLLLVFLAGVVFWLQISFWALMLVMIGCLFLTATLWSDRGSKWKVLAIFAAALLVGSVGLWYGMIVAAPLLGPFVGIGLFFIVITFNNWKWSLLLGLTYVITFACVYGVNTTAINRARADFEKTLRWTKDKVPATTTLMQNDQLIKAEIGCKGTEKLPPFLRPPEPKPPQNGNDKPDFWVRNNEQSEILRSYLFPGDGSFCFQTEDDVEKYERYFGAIEDPFDWFFARCLLIPIQPISREKQLRQQLGYTELLNNVSDDDQREQMLRHFGNVYGEFMRLFPCRMIRWINGWVQIAAIFAFWLGVLIVIRHYVKGVMWERWQAESWPREGGQCGFFPFVKKLGDREIQWYEAPAEDKDFLAVSEIRGELAALNSKELSADPGTAVLMLRETYESYLQASPDSLGRSDAEKALAAVKSRHRDRTETDMASLVYLAWALPTMGFIGTVLGLGTALLTAGDMVTPVSELQRDAIQTVSIYLGRAFDKTFVALLLSVALMALVYGVRWAMESQALRFHDNIIRGVVRRLGTVPRFVEMSNNALLPDTVKDPAKDKQALASEPGQVRKSRHRTFAWPETAAALSMAWQVWLTSAGVGFVFHALSETIVRGLPITWAAALFEVALLVGLLWNLLRIAPVTLLPFRTESESGAKPNLQRFWKPVFAALLTAVCGFVGGVAATVVDAIDFNVYSKLASAFLPSIFVGGIFVAFPFKRVSGESRVSSQQ